MHHTLTLRTPTVLDTHLFAPIAALEDADADTAAILRKIAHSFAKLAALMPKAVPVLDSLKPGIVLDVAGSHQPGAMALVAELGLFPTHVDEDGAAMLRSAFARATPAQRGDLIAQMVAIASIN